MFAVPLVQCAKKNRIDGIGNELNNSYNAEDKFDVLDDDWLSTLENYAIEKQKLSQHKSNCNTLLREIQRIKEKLTKIYQMCSNKIEFLAFFIALQKSVGYPEFDIESILRLGFTQEEVKKAYLIVT